MASPFITAVAIVAVAIGGSACSFGRVTGGGTGSVSPIKTIAMMPGGGRMAEAVAIELSRRGFAIVSSESAAGLLGRTTISEGDVARPDNAARLRAGGVDAVLTVRVSPGSEPENATARLTSVHDNSLVAGVAWQNAGAGVRGSIADRVMRKGIAEAAADIAGELAARVKPSS